MPSLIVKREAKIKAVFDILGDEVTEELFIKKFKEMFAGDWLRIKAKYAKEERDTKPGKKHPMPKPDTYMRNMYKVAVIKRQKKA